MIIPTAEPFFFPGDRTGCLLVHGFTGSPKEMRWMGEYLAGRGHTVLGVRLSAHATQPSDMLRARWQDWLVSVEDGWHLLRGMTDHIFIMGLSMGGVLSFIFAAQFPVAGIVAMSTPYEIRDPRLRWIRLLRWIQPRKLKGPPDWHNPAAALDHVDYPYYPTLAVAELRDSLAEMRSVLTSVTVPVLLIHSEADNSVPLDNMQLIYKQLGSSDKRMVSLVDCNHVITREPEREKVFGLAAEFIQRIISRSECPET